MAAGKYGISPTTECNATYLRAVFCARNPSLKMEIQAIIFILFAWTLFGSMAYSICYGDTSSNPNYVARIFRAALFGPIVFVAVMASIFSEWKD
jgi:hypothetical protein